MATPEPYRQQPTQHFGPISGTKVCTVTPSALVTGLTICRTLELRASDSNTGVIYVYQGAGLGAYLLEAGTLILVDTLYRPDTVLVASAVNGETVSYNGRFTIGE